MNKKQVIEFHSYCVMEEPGSGDWVILLNEKKGELIKNFTIQNINIADNKIEKFWSNIDNLGVWKWNKKYPCRKSKFIPMPDGHEWWLKLRDKKDKAKYCTGYESYPKNFKKFIKELNSLFGSNIKY